MRVLVDTSCWIDFLKNGNSRVYDLLEKDEIVIHPFILGELAMGGLPSDDERFLLIRQIPIYEILAHEIVFKYVEKYSLGRTGIGWVDAHLLVSAARFGAKVLTLDRKFIQACRKGKVPIL